MPVGLCLEPRAWLRRLVDGGQVRALAVTGTERVQTLPGVPTFRESGIEGLENPGWDAVFASAKTPEGIVSLLQSKLRGVMAEPDMQTKLLELGLQKADGTYKDDVELWNSSITSTQDILRHRGGGDRLRFLCHLAVGERLDLVRVVGRLMVSFGVFFDVAPPPRRR
jgi:hypothetical protein